LRYHRARFEEKSSADIGVENEILGGVTDNAWFNFLSQSTPDEVNFWQPRGAAAYAALGPGTLFLFKLKHPNHHIAGGGYFVKSTSLPLSIAWEAFGSKNGAAQCDRVMPVPPEK